MADLITAEMAMALLEAARAAAANAYIPYSDFPVGAALLLADDSIHTSCNVEIASIGLTVCAERNAAFGAAAAGHRGIRAVAVVAPKAKGTTPCGACRQVLNEFAIPGTEMLIVLDGKDGPEILTLAALLPRAFGPHDLERVR